MVRLSSGITPGMEITGRRHPGGDPSAVGGWTCFPTSAWWWSVKLAEGVFIVIRVIGISATGQV
jgi:hypothetical protein